VAFAAAHVRGLRAVEEAEKRLDAQRRKKGKLAFTTAPRQAILPEATVRLELAPLRVGVCATCRSRVARGFDPLPTHAYCAAHLATQAQP